MKKLVLIITGLLISINTSATIMESTYIEDEINKVVLERVAEIVTCKQRSNSGLTLVEALKERTNSPKNNLMKLEINDLFNACDIYLQIKD